MSDKNIKDSDIVERLRRLEEQVLPRGMNPAEGGSFSETITDENGDPIYDAETGKVPAAKIDPAVISSFNYVQDTEPTDPAEGESWYDTGSDAAYVFTDDVGSKQKINIVSHGELADVTPYAHQQPFYRQDTKPTDAIEGAMWITESDGSGNDTTSRYQYNATADVWELNSAVGPSEPSLGTMVPGATWRDTSNDPPMLKTYGSNGFESMVPTESNTVNTRDRTIYPDVVDNYKLSKGTSYQDTQVVTTGTAEIKDITIAIRDGYVIGEDMEGSFKATVGGNTVIDENLSNQGEIVSQTLYSDTDVGYERVELIHDVSYTSGINSAESYAIFADVTFTGNHKHSFE